MKERQAKSPARFFLDDDLTGASVDLPPAEARHAVKSRRLRAGDVVVLFNGRGATRAGELEQGPGRRVGVHFTCAARVYHPSQQRLTVAASPPRGDRMTFLVEKLSELGADRLLPTLFHRSLDTGLKKETARIDRWRRAAVESAKQCQRAFLLEVEPPRTLAELLDRQKNPDRKIILLNDDQTVPFQERLKSEAADTILLVGPEGGFTEEEIASVQAEGYAPACLGPRILRIETAALAGAALFRARWP